MFLNGNKYKSAREEYLRSNGAICPFCNKNSITFTDRKIQSGAEYLYRETKCFICNSVFMEEYKLNDVSISNIP